MRTSPSIVPSDDQDVYLVEDDLGHWGRVWTETDAGSTDLETVIIDMLSGQYRNPVRVIAFNVSEGWCRDAFEGRRDRVEAPLRPKRTKASGLA
jgi:hypothetical protein